MKMLENNVIEGFLSTRSVSVNNQLSYLYDISGNIPLEEKYSGKELSYDAMTANVNFLNNASYDSVYKNDPQSIYQAQASVISPLVLKLLDL